MSYSKPTPDHLILNFAALDIGYFSVKGASHRKTDGSIATFNFPSSTPIQNEVIETHQGMAGASGVIINHGGNNYYVGEDSHVYSQFVQPRATNIKYCQSDEYKVLYLCGIYHILRSLGNVMEGVTKVTIKKMVGGLPLNTIKDSKQYVRELMEGTFEIPALTGK